jgi:hypothetical protein
MVSQVSSAEAGRGSRVMGAVLAVDDGSRKVTEADIDVGVSEAFGTSVLLSVRRL